MDGKEVRMYLIAFLASMIVSFLIFSGCQGYTTQFEEEHDFAVAALTIEPVEPASAEGPPARDSEDLPGEMPPVRHVGEGSQQDCIVEGIQFLSAQLDGSELLETVVQFTLPEGPENRHVIAVYSMAGPDGPRLVTCKVAPTKRFLHHYMHAVDLNGDGIDELLSVGKARSRKAPAELGIYALEEGMLVEVAMLYYENNGKTGAGKPFVLAKAKPGTGYETGIEFPLHEIEYDDSCMVRSAVTDLLHRLTGINNTDDR